MVRGLRDRRGQALVEFALVLPLLLLLIIALVEFGWLLSNLVVVRHASYDLARQAAVGAADGDVRAMGLKHVANIVPSASALTESYDVDPATGQSRYNVTYSDDGDSRWVRVRLTPVSAGRRQGDLLTVEATLSYQPLVVGWVFQSSAHFTTRAVTRVEWPL